MYINKQWKKVMAVGCTHGDLINPSVAKQILAFKDRYQPEIRFELGDIVDTAAFRHGSKGTKDEGREVEPDKLAAVQWLESYQPTHLTWGNHDWRLMNWIDSPNAVVSHAAGCVWKELNQTLEALHCETRPYILRKNWFELGGQFWGHGQMYNENAVRDHAEYLGGPVVMAHLHAPQIVQGRTRKWSQSFCVGMLADLEQLTYADGNRSTSRWGPGCVWGEISDDSAHLHLTSCEPGEELRFPL